MDEKKPSLFRQKSLNTIETPESLNDYLRVTSPGVWLLLSAVIVLLIGACIWGIFGHIDTTVPAAVISTESGSVCLVPQSALAAVVANPQVLVEDKEQPLSIHAIPEPYVVSTDSDVYVRIAGSLEIGDIVYEVQLENTLPEGIYSATIITESIHPVRFLFN